MLSSEMPHQGVLTRFWLSISFFDKLRVEISKTIRDHSRKLAAPTMRRILGSYKAPSPASAGFGISETIHPRTSATSPFFPGVLRRRKPARRSGPGNRLRVWTHIARLEAGEDCSELARSRHAASLLPAPAGTLQYPNHHQREARQSQRWAWPARNPLVREEACQSLFPVPKLNEE